MPEVKHKIEGYNSIMKGCNSMKSKIERCNSSMKAEFLS